MLYAKDGTFPDTESTTKPQFKCVRQSIKDSILIAESRALRSDADRRSKCPSRALRSAADAQPRLASRCDRFCRVDVEAGRILPPAAS